MAKVTLPSGKHSAIAPGRSRCDGCVLDAVMAQGCLGMEEGNLYCLFFVCRMGVRQTRKGQQHDSR